MNLEEDVQYQQIGLEESIKNEVEKKLSDGTIEKVVSEKFEQAINEAVNNVFRSYSEVGKLIEAKLKEILVPGIEKYDFSEHIIKLDTILSEIVNTTVLVENKKILENFKKLMTEDDVTFKSIIKLSDIADKWFDYVSKNVETSGLEINYDDSPSYENVDVSVVFERENGRDWASVEHANIVFECEHDENMNFMLPISRWRKYDGDKWGIDFKQDPTLNSLSALSEFEVYLLKLKRMFCEIEIDDESIETDVEIEAEPEASYN